LDIHGESKLNAWDHILLKLKRVPFRSVILISLDIFPTDDQAVCVTACGNFGLAGSSTGEIRMWNMQSGKERRSFSLTGPPPGDSKPKIIAAANGKGKAKSKKLLAEKSIQAITGLATDTLNNVVVASTLEGKLYVGPA
jgi:hypothetical protein